MTDEEIVRDFVRVFRGRGDVYGNAKGFMVKEPLTLDVFTRHLSSSEPGDWIGVYCMLGEECSWGCIDIDGKDFPLDIEHDVWDWQRMWDLARNLVNVLAAKNIYGHIERTKNGYHVWVFPDEMHVPARAMRRALMAACVAVDYDPKEVNPKAEGPRPGTKGYGNFVRLPYGGYLTQSSAMQRPRVFVDGLQAVMWLQDALRTIKRTKLADLEAVARLWTPPQTGQDLQVDFDAGMEVEPILRMLDGKSYVIWRDGPLPGNDRSTTLASLAHLLCERGLTPEQGFAVLRSADSRWGKFQDRPEELAYMIERAYT